MPIINRIADFHDDMVAWRRDIHAHPETAFEETRTAAIVAGKLGEFGLEVHTGLAKTGVVGVLKCGDGERKIGLRADMDALDLQELTDLEYKSTNDGKMHACGHDGHTTMLLGAARYLAETQNFDGTVYFIFQPAEENEAGGRLMVQEGLFDQFPCSDVYGMHNIPGIPMGKIALRPGPMMASADFFEIIVTGKGSHGAFPHEGIDPVLIGAEIVMALQRIVARTTDPMKQAVISATKFQSGHTTNVIPETALIAGTTRAFQPEIQDLMEREIRRVAEGVAAAHGASVECSYDRRYAPTVNTEAETEIAAAAAATVVGEENVLRHLPPIMGSEDFSWMLQARPGCYIWIGNGDGEGSCMVHNPNYDFNDEILTVGASYWVKLVEQELAAA
ncbi:MAG: M20 aminoacylase family protein [Alphaproteobacteria bacterium]|nr:M20 aminoacylase family protein [Alphaproteobacteria bacterium]MDP6814263.1 M20 aminoacylase family protein [Alphaproteobacteria bacterium]